jgi:hypothetical protein
MQASLLLTLRYKIAVRNRTVTSDNPRPQHRAALSFVIHPLIWHNHWPKGEGRAGLVR